MIKYQCKNQIGMGFNPFNNIKKSKLGISQNISAKAYLKINYYIQQGSKYLSLHEIKSNILRK